MEIIVSGHHTDVPERFRSHVETKLSKLAQLDQRAQRVDVEVIHEPNPRQSEVADRVEITVRGKGPVLRAEAAAPDRYAAFDAAIAKLLERARRASDRRKSRHKGASRRYPPPADMGTWETPEQAAANQAALSASDAEPPLPETDSPSASVPGGAIETPLGDSPVVIREKVHVAAPMTVEDAIYEMELVGHPFFLFVDADSSLPSVLYRRHGWTYGVIRLEPEGLAAAG
jgi:ribosomal subunit interface protein